jgi:hypothetical protein
MLDEPGGVEAEFLRQFKLIEHLAIDLGVTCSRDSKNSENIA